MPYTLFGEDICLTNHCNVSTAKIFVSRFSWQSFQNYDISSERLYADSLDFIKHVECMSVDVVINLSGAVCYEL